MKRETILVTGAAGFVGSEIVRQLIADGKPVRAMIRSQQGAAELTACGAEVIITDLKDPEGIRKAVDGVTSVIHIAALFRQAGLPESEFHAVNVTGTKNLLDAAIAAGAKRFIHCSTVGVHGNIEVPPADENCPYNPGDMYQRSKTEGEKLVLQYFAEDRIRGVVIRPAMIWGPNDRRTLKLFKMVSKGTFFYVGAGQALVHFIDVRDLARAFRIAEQRSDLHNSVYIIGGRKAVPLAAVANEIAAVFDVRKPWLHVPIKPLQLLGSLCEAVCTPLHIDPPLYRRRVDFFTKNRSFDCRKAETELGFFSTQSIHEEIVDIANSYIVSGEVARQALSAPGTIIRDITGSIRSIDESAERLYGYSQAGVTGKIIHTLLRTVFPVPLDRINAELKEKGIWVGNLVHQTSTGEQIRVFSRWELKHSESGEDLVQESHYARGISRTNSTGISERLASVGSFIAGMLLCGRTLL